MRKIYILLLIILLFNCCNRSVRMEEADVELEIADSVIIKNINTGSICCNDSLIYISNTYENTISAYDYTGNKKFTFGGAGNGPAEFSSSPIITLMDSLLLACNMINYEIKSFTLKGEYKQNYDYTRAMMIPVTNLLAHKDIYIEGYSINPLNNCMSHKIIKLHNSDNFEIFKEIEIKKIENFEDIFKNLDPFQREEYLYKIGNKFAYLFHEDSLRIYSQNDTNDISLKFIPKSQVDKQIKDFILSESETTSSANNKLDMTYSFPEYLPRLKSVFILNNNILCLSERQYLANKMDSTANSIYLYDMETLKSKILNLPKNLKVSNIVKIYNDKIFILKEETIKIYNVILH